jgi:hypothetical protein
MMHKIEIKFIANGIIALGLATLMLAPLLENPIAITIGYADEPAISGELKSDSLELTNPHLKKMGVKECAACHTQPGFLYPQTGVTQFVRLTEAEQWYRNDKHAYAYELVRLDLSESDIERPERLSNRTARTIVAQLGWKSGDGNFERNCLTCHAGLLLEDNWRTDSIQENLPYGVQCEACHGPAEKYMQTTEHQQPTWRTKSPDQKKELGMYDLSIAATCAEICLSCHLGDLSQGRFITHEMYSAGHPPLPPFDLQTFLDAMPPHWGTVQEKPYPNPLARDASTFQYQREYLLNHFLIDTSQPTTAMQDAVQRSMERSKRSKVGTMVAQNTALKLIHDASQQPEFWGDYALFDCMGCHQALDRNRTRFRPAGRIPGRPFPPNWSALSDPQISFNSSTAAIQAKIDAIFNALPFGDRDRWILENASFEKYLSERRTLALVSSKLILDPSDITEWIDLMIQQQSPKLNDYWVAKQTAWMVRIAVDELVTRKHLDQESVAEDLNALDRILGLNLAIPQRESVLVQQPTTLQAARSFDAAAVQKHLEAIQRSLKEVN